MILPFYGLPEAALAGLEANVIKLSCGACRKATSSSPFDFEKPLKSTGELSSPAEAWRRRESPVDSAASLGLNLMVVAWRPALLLS